MQVFYTLPSMKGGFCTVVGINLVFFEDTAFISSKSHFDRYINYWVISIPKMQTDGHTAFQLYIVDYFGHIYTCMYIILMPLKNVWEVLLQSIVLFLHGLAYELDTCDHEGISTHIHVSKNQCILSVLYILKWYIS